jgi:hypothetical protein
MPTPRCLPCAPCTNCRNAHVLYAQLATNPQRREAPFSVSGGAPGSNRRLAALGRSAPWWVSILLGLMEV